MYQAWRIALESAPTEPGQCLNGSVGLRALAGRWTPSYYL